MGLSASQGRLLFISMRQNDVSARMQRISMSNIILARDEDDLMAEYNRGVNATKKVPVDELAVTYDNLMGVGAAAQNQFTLVTTNDDNHQVVLSERITGLLGVKNTATKDEAKAELAARYINSGEDIKRLMAKAVEELGTPTGAGNRQTGDWADSVSKVIAEYGEYPQNEKAVFMKDLTNSMQHLANKCSPAGGGINLGMTNGYAHAFDFDLTKVLNGTQGQFIELVADGDTSGTPHGTAKDYFTRVATELARQICKSLDLPSDVIFDEAGNRKDNPDPSSQSQLFKRYGEFIDKCAQQIDSWTEDDAQIKDFIDTWATSTRGSADNDHIAMSVERLLKKMLSDASSYYGGGVLYSPAGKFSGESKTAGAFASDKMVCLTYNSKGYSASEWEDRLKQAWINDGFKANGMSWPQALKEALGEATSTKNNLVNGTTKTGYYENLYKELCERGWVTKNSNDIQNGIESGEFHVAGQKIQYTTLYEEVPDEEARAEAETKYNLEMKKIQRKEKQLDAELTKLQTEYSALSQDYTSVKSILDQNIQRSFQYCQTG